MLEREADVAVIGFGGAGAAAAIEAHDAGASVIVLEKTSAGGGTTRESSGNIRIISDPRKAEQHYCELTMGTTPLAVMRTFVHGVSEIPKWIESLGGVVQPSLPEPIKYVFPYIAPTTSYPEIAGSEGIGGRWAVKAEGDEGGGAALWRVLEKNAQVRAIEVLYNTRAQRLVRNGDGIVGVKAIGPEGEVWVRINRAVVLSCGGFSYNAEMQRQFLGVEVAAFSPPGSNTGDGVKLAQDVGADLWHMTAAVAGFGYKVPGYEAAFCAGISSTGFFIVDQKARRFFNEAHVEFHSALLSTQVVDAVHGKRYRIPSYLIFDDATRRAGPIATRVRHSFNQRFKWSDDNSEEIKKGWIQTGASLSEIANRLGLSVEALELTMKKYNGACDHGGDEFGRRRALMRRMDGPPFYGIAIWPALSNTQGGPRRNENAQVVDVFGNPIPGLYSAGELGSIWGPLYPGAGNVSECIVFGRIAGRNAAQRR